MVEKGKSVKEASELAADSLLAICNASNDGIVSTDASGTVVFVNEAALRVFGYSHAELEGQSLTMLLAPRLREAYTQAITAMLAGEQTSASDGVFGRTIELSGQRKEGGEFPLEISLGYRSNGGKAVVTAVLRDITERKKLDYEAVKLAAMIARGSNDRRQAEEVVKRKNLELETLLYVTSHDLKEPLRAISNFSSILVQRYEEALDDKGKDFLHRVVTAATRMNQLLDDILDLCRAGQMEVPAIDVEAEKIVRLLLNRLEIKIKESAARIEIVQPLPKLRVNSLWASQGIYNLILNALKFTKEGEAPDIQIAGYETPDQVGIVVRDRGPGVAPEHQERIFQLFQRAVGREVAGTGAGLAIVRQIADRHYGQAWVRPREGGGSEFIITFGPPPEDDSAGD